MTCKNFFIQLLICVCLTSPIYSKNKQYSEPLSAKEENLIRFVQKSIDDANLGVSKLPSEVLEIHGMCGLSTRHLLNNLCKKEQTGYLEIGCWKGSTWIAALYNNANSIKQAVAIDNFSEFYDGQIEQIFHSNCIKFLNDLNYQFYCTDCFDIEIEHLFSSPVTIYFYDGNHTALSHELAFTYYNNILDDVFITLVDDWNWRDVREGTYQAFKKLNYKILFEKQLINNHAKWANGLYIAVIRK